MIETIVLAYLKQRMDITVLMEYPESEDDNPFVVIEKTGGSEKNHIKTSTLAIQTVSRTLYEAAVLCERLIEVMKNAIELDEICAVKPNGSYNFTDPKSKKYRYQAVFEITHY